jgi:hypothetical protein
MGVGTIRLQNLARAGEVHGQAHATKERGSSPKVLEMKVIYQYQCVTKGPLKSLKFNSLQIHL